MKTQDMPVMKKEDLPKVTLEPLTEEQVKGALSKIAEAKKQLSEVCGNCRSWSASGRCKRTTSDNFVAKTAKNFWCDKWTLKTKEDS